MVVKYRGETKVLRYSAYHGSSGAVVDPNRVFWLRNEDHYVNSATILGLHVLKNQLTGHTFVGQPSEIMQIESYRQRNPYDSPPDVGFDRLRMEGGFIRPTRHFVRRMYYNNHPKNLIHWVDEAIPGGGRVWHPFPPAAYIQGDWLPKEEHEFTGNPNEAQEIALRNLYASLQRRQKIAGGVILGELKESIGLIGKAITSILQIVRALKRGRVRDALRVIKEYGISAPRGQSGFRHLRNRSSKGPESKLVSSADYASSMWLEIQFGWLPILSDIHSAIQLVTEGLNLEEGRIVSVKGYGANSWEESYISDSYLFVGGQPLKRKVTMKYDRRVSYQATFRISDSTAAFLQTIGLANPASIAWELVPFSFVADWFIPVNAWLNGLTATMGLELLDFTASHKKKGVKTATWDFSSVPPVLNYLGEDITQVYRGRDLVSTSLYEEFSRIPNIYEDMPPMPLPKLSMADFTDPWLAITSSSLIFQVFGKRKA